MEESTTNRREAIRGWLQQYIIDLVILFMAWGGYYRCTLANSDTLIGNINPAATLEARLQNYRWLGYVGDGLSYALGYLPYEHQKLSLGLFLVVMAAALVLLQRTFSEVLGDRLQSDRARLVFIAVTALCYVNVLIAEMFYFTETFLCFKMSMLLAMLGCWLFSRRHYASGTMVLLLAPMFYQMACVQAALVLCTLAVLEEQGAFSWRLVRKELCYILVPMGAGLLNYGTGPAILSVIGRFTGVEYYTAKQMADFSQIFGAATIGELRDLYESSLGLMMPLYLPLLFSAAITLAVLVSVYRRPRVLTTYLVYKVVALTMTLALQLMSDGTTFVPRVICVFYYMQAMNAMMALYCVDRERLRRCVHALCVGYLLVQVFFIQIIIANRGLSEYIDRSYAEQILAGIQAYEEESGIQVRTIAFHNDEHMERTYDGVYFSNSAINTRLYGDYAYSLVETVARERGLSYEWADVDPEVYEAYFAGHDWEAFDFDAQAVFVGDTLHMCVF